MIRHSSSFFISLVFHTILALLLFYTYKSVVSFEDKENDKIEIKLCSVVEKKELIEKPEEQKEVLKKPPLESKKKTITQELKPSEKIEKKTVPITKEVQEQKESTEEQKIQEKSVDSIPKNDYMQNHLKQIVKLLQENLYYPRSARKRGITGEVVVKFKLSKDARVHNIEVISAESDILSRAAIKTIEDLSGKFPKPDSELTLSLPIRYSLSR